MEKRLSAIVSMDLVFPEVASISYAHGTNHLMGKETADHLEIKMATM